MKPFRDVLWASIPARFRRLPSPVLPPIAQSRVSGVIVTMDQKEGTLLFMAEESLQGEKQPATEGTYYELKLACTGDNSEYPREKEPIIFKITIGHKDIGTGGIGNVFYAPAGSRFTHFELVEEYNDGPMRNNVIVGGCLPPHHALWLNAHYVKANGTPLHLGAKAWTRKSDEPRPLPAFPRPDTYLPT